MRILLDVDGVLADFVTPALAVINTITGDAYRPQDITQHDITLACKLTDAQIKHWEAAISAPGFCASIQPYPSVDLHLERLRSVGDVIAVTAPLTVGNYDAAPHWLPERYDWLRRMSFGHKEIIFASDKSFIDGNYFVDDKVSNVEAWLKRQNWCGHMSAFVFAQPWNLKHKRFSIKSLSEVYDDITTVRF